MEKKKMKSTLWHSHKLIYFSVAEAVIFLFYDFFGAEKLLHAMTQL